MGQRRAKIGPRWAQHRAKMGQHRAKIGPRCAKMGPRWDNIRLRCREEKNKAKMTQKKPNHHGRDVFPLLGAGGRRRGGREPFSFGEGE